MLRIGRGRDLSPSLRLESGNVEACGTMMSIAGVWQQPIECISVFIVAPRRMRKEFR